MKPVLLWSDILIYVLVISAIVFFMLIKNDAQVKSRWLAIFQSRVGMLSFIVISFYVLIALLDSIHYQKALPLQEGDTTVHYSGEVSSVLDAILVDLKSHTEVSYSKPLRCIPSRKKINTTVRERFTAIIPV